MKDEDVTTFKVQLNMLKESVIASNGSSNFLDLAASAVPASAMPMPAFDKGNEGANDKQQGANNGDNGDASISVLTNWQYIMLGAFLGILATVIYYKLAKFFQAYRDSQV